MDTHDEENRKSQGVVARRQFELGRHSTDFGVLDQTSKGLGGGKLGFAMEGTHGDVGPVSESVSK